MMDRDEGEQRQQQQHHILEETLQVRKVHGLAKTAAVHFRIGPPEDEGDDGEKREQRVCNPGGDFAEHAGDKRYAKGRLQQREKDADHLGCRRHEVQVEELEILRDNEHRPHRVHDFEDTGTKQENAYEHRHEAAQPKVVVLHGRKGSTVWRTRLKMASGGNMEPSGALQSILRK